MKQRDNHVYLRRILDAIAQIEQYSAGISYEEFSRNRLPQDGVGAGDHR